MITWHNHKRHRRDKPRHRPLTQFGRPVRFLMSDYRKWSKQEKLMAQAKSDKRNLRQRMLDENFDPDPGPDPAPQVLSQNMSDLINAMYRLGDSVECAARALGQFEASLRLHDPLPSGVRWSKRMEHYLYDEFDRFEE